jgi:protein SCO1/2
MHPRVRLTLMAAGGLALVAALLVALSARSGEQATANGFDGSLRPPGIPVSDFALRDQDGKLVRLSSSRGKVTVVTFLYTTCRDTCPLVAQQISMALDRLGHAVPVIAVSVDPAHDTPALARRFLEARQLQRRMEFLLGTEAQLAPVWGAYGIRPQGKGYEHSSYVILLDRQGRQRVSFPGDRLTPESLEHDIRRLESDTAA